MKCAVKKMVGDEGLAGRLWPLLVPQKAKKIWVMKSWKYVPNGWNKEIGVFWVMSDGWWKLSDRWWVIDNLNLKWQKSQPNIIEIFPHICYYPNSFCDCLLSCPINWVLLIISLSLSLSLSLYIYIYIYIYNFFGVCLQLTIEKIRIWILEPTLSWRRK